MEYANWNSENYSSFEILTTKMVTTGSQPVSKDLQAVLAEYGSVSSDENSFVELEGIFKRTNMLRDEARGRQQGVSQEIPQNLANERQNDLKVHILQLQDALQRFEKPLKNRSGFSDQLTNKKRNPNNDNHCRGIMKFLQFRESEMGNRIPARVIFRVRLKVYRSSLIYSRLILD